MSRFSDSFDYDDERAVLDQGRWENNARRALKGKRGRKALADLREALMALPEHRLIDSAMCTVGGADKRAPLMTEQEMGEYAGKSPRRGGDPKFAFDWAEYQRQGRAEVHSAVAGLVSQQGEGVCAVAAYAWHQKVKAGMDPQEAFASLPLVFSDDPDVGDPLTETAYVGEDAGLTFTLAWELAYRNDETYDSLTPEQRWEHFVTWIDRELASTQQQES
jgi:hypothetical protein